LDTVQTGGRVASYRYDAAGRVATTTDVREIRPGLPGLSASAMLVPAADGREVYEFSAGGRHLRTADGFAGKTLVVFDYDSTGLLVALRDSLGNGTEIERSGQGVPTAIVAPFGQRTELTLDGNGYLATVEDPAGNQVQLTHSETGLLTELLDPRGHAYRFAYDTTGRLVADTAADGGVKTLARVMGDSGYAVTLTSALGRETEYAIEQLDGQVELRTVTDPAGLVTSAWRTPSGVDSTRTPGGTRTMVTRLGDPRFGTAVSFPGPLVVTLPSGDSSVITNRRSAVRSDSANPFTLLSETDSTTINGQLWRTAYDAATQRVTSTSPVGRQSFTTLDSLGRVRVVRTPGLDSVVYGYDTRGRLSQVQTGGRVASYTYDSSGRLATTTDPLNRTDSLFYDSADRLTRQVLPGGREIAFAYDSSGNLTSVTPSGNVSARDHAPQDDARQGARAKPEGGALGGRANGAAQETDREDIVPADPLRDRLEDEAGGRARQESNARRPGRRAHAVRVRLAHERSPTSPSAPAPSACARIQAAPSYVWVHGMMEPATPRRAPENSPSAPPATAAGTEPSAWAPAGCGASPDRSTTARAAAACFLSDMIPPDPTGPGRRTV
jgi:YD repeat-containing protein